MSQNMIDINLASTTDDILKLACGNLYQAISSGKLEDFINLIETSDGKSSELEQSTLDHALLTACSMGRKFVVPYLLLKGASINTNDPLGYTPLLVSVERGFTDIARLLLDKGADVNASNIRGDSALTLSIRTCGSTDMLGLLLKQKSVDVNHRNREGYTCWMKAVEALDFDAVKLLIKSGLVINKDVKDCIGQAHREVSTLKEPASHVSKKFDADAIISYLEREAKGYESSLRLAVFQRDLYSTRYLIDCGIFGADVNNDQDLISDFLFDIESKDCPLSQIELEIIRKLLQTGANVQLRRGYTGCKILIYAVNIGSSELVDLLCQHGAHPNTHAYIPPHQNAVGAAAEKGRCDLLKILMKYNGNIHCNNGPLNLGYLKSPLQAALESGHVNVVKLLLENGVSVNVEEGLHIAITHKRLDSLKYLVETFSDPSRSAIESNSRGLIHKAVESGDVDIINTLLDFGSNVNCVFDEKTLPMNAKTPEVMELLIKRGADVNMPTDNVNRINILSYIIVRELKEERPKELNRKQQSTEEASLVNTSDLKEMVEMLLRSGASVDDTDSRGQTPLMAAAKHSGAGGVLTTLLEAGAKVNKADAEGFSALHIAAISGFLENVEILKTFGAHVNQKCNDGLTALHAAVHNEAVLTFLLQNGADVNAEDAKGNTALLTVSKINRDKSCAGVLKILLEAGSKVNHRNADGETALMKAAFCLDDTAIKTLCEANADMNVRNICNTEDATSILVDRQCKAHSAYGEVRDSIFYLLDRGGSSSCVSFQNLFYFISNGCLEVVQRLVEAGLGPSEAGTDEILLRYPGLQKAKNVSPFYFALLCNQVKLARFFSDIWYLTTSDVKSLFHDRGVKLPLVLKRNQESLEFLTEFSSQPISLQKLCFVVVSTSIGTGPDREQKIRDISLPNMFKNKLRFTTGCAPDLRADDASRKMLLWPGRASNYLVFGDIDYESDASDSDHYYLSFDDYNYVVYDD